MERSDTIQEQVRSNAAAGSKMGLPRGAGRFWSESFRRRRTRRLFGGRGKRSANVRIVRVAAHRFGPLQNRLSQMLILFCPEP